MPSSILEAALVEAAKQVDKHTSTDETSVLPHVIDEDEVMSVITCNQCRYESPNERQLSNYMKYAHELQCKVCGSKFNDATNIQDHIVATYLQHSGEVLELLKIQ